MAQAVSRTRDQHKSKLAERLKNPHVQSARPNSVADCCKIKLRTADHWLVYQAQDKRPIVTVIALGRRDKGLCICWRRSAFDWCPISFDQRLASANG